MLSHPVELVYKSLTSIVAPCMPEPENVQEVCSCCQRPADTFGHLGYRFKNCYNQPVSCASCVFQSGCCMMCRACFSAC